MKKRGRPRKQETGTKRKRSQRKENKSKPSKKTKLNEEDKEDIIKKEVFGIKNEMGIIKGELFLHNNLLLDGEEENKEGEINKMEMEIEIKKEEVKKRKEEIINKVKEEKEENINKDKEEIVIDKEDKVKKNEEMISEDKSLNKEEINFKIKEVQLYNEKYEQEEEESEEEIILKGNYRLNKNLPIFNYAYEILTTILHNQVVIISGHTGCGKTTQIPLLLYHYGKNRNKDFKILITQPRRLAVTSIAKRLKEEIKENVVGYHIRENPQFTPFSKIIIKTTGIFLQDLVHKNPELVNYSHIILDEIHERSIDIDMVMLLVKHLLKRNNHIKLILMSASIATHIFSSYYNRESICNIENQIDEKVIYKEEESDIKKEDKFSGWLGEGNFDKDFDEYRKQCANVGKREGDAPIITINEKLFPIREFFLENIEQNIKNSLNIDLNIIPNFDINLPIFSEELIIISIYVIQSIIMKKVNSNDHLGSILVFLPGMGEINRYYDILKEKLSLEEQSSIQIYILHSNISDSQQFSIFEKTYKRKIILSTNIAESSITINDTCYVIDFCLGKELYYNSDKKNEKLILKWISKASCSQRGGRTGRVCIGYVFRMITKNFYSQLDEFPYPEILRLALERVILKIKIFDCGEPWIILRKAITHPRLSNILKAIKNLIYINALTINDTNFHSGKLTEFGKIYAEMPIDMQYTRLIILSYCLGMGEIGVTIASILSNENSIFNENGNRLQLYNIKKKFSCGTNCDMLTCYSAYKEWENQCEILKDNEEYIISWCKLYMLNIKELKRVSLTRKEIIKKLEYLNVIIEKNNDKEEICDFMHNRQLIDFFKFIITGAFYEKMLKSGYLSIDAIERQKKEQEKTGIDYSNVLIFKNVSDDIQSNTLINYLSHFGRVEKYIEYINERIIMFSEENFNKNGEKIIFIGSNYSLSNGISIKQGYQYYTLRQPECLYELTHIDIFTSQYIQIEPQSINYAIIEKDIKKANLYTHVCDSYFESKNRKFARYICRLPYKPMIDHIFILLFAPDVIFLPNKKNNQYHSFIIPSMTNSEIIFNYLFSSVDVTSINEIRKEFNQLIRLKETKGIDIPKITKSREHLMKEMDKLINKKRIRVIVNDAWERCVREFFPEKNFPNSEFLKFYNENEYYKEINKNTCNNNKDNFELFKPLKHLKIYEDYRLWTNEGIDKIEQERQYYKKMRERLKEKISERILQCKLTTPEIICEKCFSFICYIQNVNLCKGNEHQVNFFGFVPTVSSNESNIQYNNFVDQYKMKQKKLPKEFFQCFGDNHIIGYKDEGKFYFTNYSLVLVRIPGGINVSWSDYINDIKRKEYLAEGELKREMYIKEELKCELCNKSFSGEIFFKEHLVTREHLIAMKELDDADF